MLELNPFISTVEAQFYLGLYYMCSGRVLSRTESIFGRLPFWLQQDLLLGWLVLASYNDGFDLHVFRQKVSFLFLACPKNTTVQHIESE